jgi:hypothetical protein
MTLVFYRTKDNEVLRGNFYRNKSNNAPILETIFNLRDGINYIAGLHGDTIYLGSTVQSDSVQCLNYENRNSTLKFVQGGKTGTKATVRYPFIFHMFEMNNKIIRANLSNRENTREFLLPVFTDAIPVTKNSFAFRTYNEMRSALQLGKLSDEKLERFPSLLRKQLDGIFCTDGILTFNQQEEKLFYVYFYRNQFLCLDTSMNLLYTGKTIDTISQVKIKVAFTSDDSRKLASPARLVNRYACSGDSVLFVVSQVLGETEQLDDLRNGSMIDCYRTRNGEYLRSFHLPNYKNQRLVEISISKSRLFALYQNYLLVYSLP